MLRNRLLTAIVLIPIVIGTDLLGGWWLFAVLGTGVIICGYEYFTMLPAAGYRPLRELGLVLIAALLVDSLLGLQAARVILLAVVVLPPLWELRRREHAGFLLNWALTALGVVFFGELGAHVFFLRDLGPRGATLLGITLMATWTTDTAAYIAGRSFGRHSFFPDISPKKTWEGAIGGIVGAMIVFGVLLSIFGIPPVLAFAGGLGVGVAGTSGDLVESLVKRQVGVKDAGTLLLGHGGVWDRLDSMLFTVPFAYYFLSAILPT